MKKWGIKSRKVYSLSGAIPSSVVYTGPGKSMADTMQRISSAFSSSLFISIGYAGGLSEKLKAGDIVLCQRFLCENRDTILPFSGLNAQVASRLKEQKVFFHEGDCYTADRVLSCPENKESLGQKGNLVVEMENYWAAQKSIERKIPFVAIRIVLDSMDSFLPDLSDTLKENGDISFLHTFWHILRSPQHIPDMIHLYKITRKIEPVLLRCCSVLAGIEI